MITQPWLISCSLDLKIIIWDTDNMNILNYFKPSNTPVHCFIFCQMEQNIFTVSEDSSIKKWRLHRPELIETIQGFSCSLSNECLAVSEDLNLIAGLSKKNLCKIAVYHIQEKKILTILEGHTEIVNCILINKSKKLIISGGDDNTILIHSCLKFVLLHRLDKVHMSDIRSMVMNPRENYLLTAGHDKRFNLISLDNPEKPVACGRIKQRINKILYIYISGEIICISDEKQRFYVWNVDADLSLQNSCKLNIK